MQELPRSTTAQVASKHGVPLYASTPEAADTMPASGITVAGSLEQLPASVDVVTNCTPKGVCAKNLNLYHQHGGKAAFQGRGAQSLSDHSVVAQVNYDTALGRDYTRVVSCNTTRTVRTLTAPHDTGR